MPIYEDDQCKTATMVVNGEHVSATAAQLKATASAGSVYTFTAGFSHYYNGQHLQYHKAVAYVLDANLKAALLAVNAPMVAA